VHGNQRIELYGGLTHNLIARSLKKVGSSYVDAVPGLGGRPRFSFNQKVRHGPFKERGPVTDATNDI